MFSLNVREEWIQEQLDKNDEEFMQTISGEYIPQYILEPNETECSSEKIIRYIYEKYPEQAQKSYEKLSKFTVQDLEGLLNGCTRMSETHKKFALRFFKMRYQEFEQLHCSYKGIDGNQTDNKAKLEQLVETARNIKEELQKAQQQVAETEGQQVIAEEIPGMEEPQ